MGLSQRVEAQDKKKEEKEKQMQETIEAQKKAMVEQKKAQEEAQKEVEKVTQESLKEYNVELQKAFEEARVKIEDPVVRDRIFKVYEDMGKTRNWSTGEPFVFTPGIQFYGQHIGEDTERTTWEFSKYVKETSFSRDYTFDVEPTVNTVVMSVNGDCKAGEIRIKIVMPGGKTYSDIVIDEFGNLNWRKSFTISDTENKDKAGSWKFEINSSKASGYFKISLQTY